ncbi:hypothetical protein LTR78_000591 [Recurvomyces mirabilis]|uniref:DUF7730 domain-containing protein n=1 Tax=Recurvomyces mirabilis TaxID=574656 RepID=A0AAE0WY86_9PEZI|nr:hypothetical protein LTR78_000591 [Recurvomyces mirabilis]KAK5162245.1 hypothetical protein LTS14_000592 [Recurvomyces mirabilis]
MVTRTTHLGISLLQQDCTLYELPGELRNRIWSYIFASPLKAHFHIQGGKIQQDFCTFGSLPDPAARQLNHAATRTSIIRTCRAFYREVTPFLYGNTTFDLVLGSDKLATRTSCLLGNNNLFARPQGHGPDSSNSVQVCTLFRHISQTNLIIQPGTRSNINSYINQLQSLLRTLSLRAPRLHHLKLHIFISRHDHIDHNAAPQIVQALFGIAKLPALKSLDFYGSNSADHYEWAEDLEFMDACWELHEYLAKRRPDIGVAYPVSDEEDEHCCRAHHNLSLMYSVADAIREVCGPVLLSTFWTEVFWGFMGYLKVAHGLVFVACFIYWWTCKS